MPVPRPQTPHAGSVASSWSSFLLALPSLPALSPIKLSKTCRPAKSTEIATTRSSTSPDPARSASRTTTDTSDQEECERWATPPQRIASVSSSLAGPSSSAVHVTPIKGPRQAQDDRTSGLRRAHAVRLQHRKANAISIRQPPRLDSESAPVPATASASTQSQPLLRRRSTSSDLRRRPSCPVVVFGEQGRRDQYLEGLYNFALDKENDVADEEEPGRRWTDEDRRRLALRVEQRTRRRQILEDRKALKVVKVESRNRRKEEKRAAKKDRKQQGTRKTLFKLRKPDKGKQSADEPSPAPVPPSPYLSHVPLHSQRRSTGGTLATFASSDGSRTLISQHKSSFVSGSTACGGALDSIRMSELRKNEYLPRQENNLVCESVKALEQQRIAEEEQRDGLGCFGRWKENVKGKWHTLRDRIGPQKDLVTYEKRLSGTQVGIWWNL